jgi:tetratricopeptide (TPR) repeat protein
MKKLIFLIIISLAFACQTETAEEYFKSGLAKAKKYDYTGAISDYDKAIELDSKFAKAYYWRGDAKFAMGDKQCACTDLYTSRTLGCSNHNSSYEADCN